MRTDDQWFVPGDKVVRVSNGEGTPTSGTVKKHGRPNVQWGTVYCVSDFYEGPRFNAVMLVGHGEFLPGPGGTKIGYTARAFRKVEEIRLCVQAANAIKQAAGGASTPTPA